MVTVKPSAREGVQTVLRLKWKIVFMLVAYIDVFSELDFYNLHSVSARTVCLQPAFIFMVSPAFTF